MLKFDPDADESILGLFYFPNCLCLWWKVDRCPTWPKVGMCVLPVIRWKTFSIRIRTFCWWNPHFDWLSSILFLWFWDSSICLYKSRPALFLLLWIHSFCLFSSHLWGQFQLPSKQGWLPISTVLMWHCRALRMGRGMEGMGEGRFWTMRAIYRIISIMMCYGSDCHPWASESREMRWDE